jgi:hypothetical protein
MTSGQRSPSFHVMRCVLYPALLALLLVSSTAAADEAPFEERRFLGGGFVTSFEGHVLAGLALEGATRIPRRPLWIRASFARANIVQLLPDTPSGVHYRGSIGFEAHSCASPAVCALTGVELGYYHERRTADHEMQYDEGYNYGARGGARLGLDLGGQNLRFRFALGVSKVYRQRDDLARDLARDLTTSVDLTLGLGMRM